MPRKKVEYRINNYIATEQRVIGGAALHPALLDGIKKIARQEHRTVSWVIESALSDYFGIEVLLHKTKKPPKPAYFVRNGRW
jgi:hypothetical protein